MNDILALESLIICYYCIRDKNNGSKVAFEELRFEAEQNHVPLLARALLANTYFHGYGVEQGKEVASQLALEHGPWLRSICEDQDRFVNLLFPIAAYPYSVYISIGLGLEKEDNTRYFQVLREAFDVKPYPQLLLAVLIKAIPAPTSITRKHLGTSSLLLQVTSRWLLAMSDLHI